MRIIVDACGGDNAPLEIVRGCIEALEEYKPEIVLVGKGEEILQILNDDGHKELPAGMEIAHAGEVVEMEDNPATTLKDKPDSSMAVGLRLLAEGKGDAFVSAGSTGALLSASTFTVKRIKGIRRAALGAVIPTKTGNAILMDSGANVECSAEYLLQFAYMGSYYMQSVMGIENPRIGLLNVGTEETKGTELRREAYALLSEANLNFIGNVEGRDAVLGSCDVIVTDGFAGNVLLKTMEGVGSFFASMLKGMFTKNIFTKLASLFVGGGIRDFKNKMDYSQTGGAPLLGLNRPVIKAHGSSGSTAIKNAIRQASSIAESAISETITKNIGSMRKDG